MNSAVAADHIMRTYLCACKRERLKRFLATVLCRMVNDHKIRLAHIEIDRAHPGSHSQAVLRWRLFDLFGNGLKLFLMATIGIGISPMLAMDRCKGKKANQQGFQPGVKLHLGWFGFCGNSSLNFYIMARNVSGKKVAILTENGFEEVELTSPMNALEEAGAEVHVISPQTDKVKAWDHDHWSIEIPVDKTLDEARPEDYDMLVLPGGVMNPDTLRQNKKAVAFAQYFLEQGKPLAAICHGPQLLIETGMLNERNMTSFPSLKTDLKNAGAIWEDKEVIVDNGLVTSRKPADLEAFNKKMIEELSEGQHATTGQFTQNREA